MTIKEFFATDKLLHAGACFTLSVLFATIFSWCISYIVIGALIAVAFGIGKEIYDAIKTRHFSFSDLCWDIIGAFGAAICLMILESANFSLF